MCTWGMDPGLKAAITQLTLYSYKIVSFFLGLPSRVKEVREVRGGDILHIMIQEEPDCESYLLHVVNG